jgi:membrane associated rhomboid family serine protease
MLYIVLGNILVYVLTMMDTTGLVYQKLCFSGAGILRGEVWRIVTYLLVPGGGSPILFLIEMYFYFWIGSSLENEWGAGKFTIYYLIGALLQAVFGVLLTLILKQDIVITATYLNLSMFFAFATLFPDVTVLLFFILPIKVKWLAYVDAALFVIAVVTTPFPVNLLPVVAVLNYLLFCGGWLFDRLRPARVRQERKTVAFQAEARRIRSEQAQRGYRHKCEVCGRTDAEFPTLQFRYCSRCAGYHCYCEDHISNHTHIQ